MTEQDLAIRPKSELIDSCDEENTYHDLFNRVSELDENDIYIKSNCKFCVHPIRYEAEQKYERMGSYAPIERMFDDYAKEHKSSPKMSYQNIRNHIHNHYMAQERQIYLREYADKHAAWMNYKISLDKKFESLQKTIEIQLMEVASNPRLNPLKQAETMTKLTKILLEIIVVQSRLRGELKHVTVITEKFQRIWIHLITAEKDENVKKKLVEACDVFRGHVSEMQLETEK